MNWHLSYDDAARWEENQTFVTGYTDIQDAFFRMLEESGCLTRQELTERFSRYALVIQAADGSYRRNCGLAFMSGEDRNFLSEFMLTNRIAYLTRNVRSYARRRGPSERRLFPENSAPVPDDKPHAAQQEEKPPAKGIESHTSSPFPLFFFV